LPSIDASLLGSCNGKYESSCSTATEQLYDDIVSRLNTDITKLVKIFKLGV